MGWDPRSSNYWINIVTRTPWKWGQANITGNPSRGPVVSPRGTTFPSDLQCLCGKNCPPLGWSGGIGQGHPKRRWLHGGREGGLLYADYGLVDSTNLVWLYWAFDVLIGLFELVGLQTNVTKTVAMVCQLGTIAGRKSTEAYGQRMNGKGTLNVRGKPKEWYVRSVV